MLAFIKNTMLWIWVTSWLPRDETAWFIVPWELLPFFIGALFAYTLERKTVIRITLVSLLVYLLFEALFLLWPDAWRFYAYLIGMTALKLLAGIGIFKALRLIWMKCRRRAG